MTQQKQSFFERLTGIKKVNDTTGEEEFVINAEGASVMETDAETTGFAPNSFEVDETAYRPALEQNMEQQPSNTTSPSGAAPTPTNNPSSASATAEEESEGQLTIDVYQTDDDIIIKSTIAGVKPEDLDVSINNDMVTIKGERKRDEEVPAESYYYQECYWGPFSRSIILPVEIVADKAEAIMKNGILTLKLPKADTTKVRKIQVRGF